VKLLPATLSGRLMATLLAGLLAAQVVAAVILLRDRAAAIYEASGLNAAHRVAGVVRVLQYLDSAGRETLLPVLGGDPLRVELLHEAPAPLQNGGRHGAHLRRTVARLAGDPERLEVALLHPGGTPVADAAGPDGRQERHGGVVLVAQTPLGDGTWLRVEHRLGSQPFRWPLRLLSTLGVLLLSVVGLTLLVVRWLNRPLALLAAAADDLGENIHRPPLAVEGPTEVRRAAAAFNTMQARLQHHIQERERTLAAISHDLRTPITRLRLRADLVDDPALRNKMEADLAEMETMTAAALDLLRGAGGEEAVEPVDLTALLDSLQSEYEEMGHRVTVEGEAGAPYPGRLLALKRLFSNLIGNAVHYGGAAAVTLEALPNRLRITVADEGPGIPDAERESVFEPFFRLEGSRSRETGGVGLGLAVARDIARLHGGEITLENNTPTGLRAVVELPY